MCVTTGLVLGASSLALQGVGMLTKAGGAQASGAAAAQAAQYQAQVALNNQLIANEAAEHAVEVGLTKAEIQSMRGATTVGRIKASQAANGVDVNTGSAVDVRAGARMASKLDAETELSNAEWTGWGWKSKAATEGASAGLDEMAAQSDLAGGRSAALGDIVGGAGSILQNASQLPFGKIFGGGSSSPGADPLGQMSNNPDTAGVASQVPA